jgi:hypothetical protein
VASRDNAVRLEGFKEFKRDLKKLQPAVEKEFRKDIATAAKKVAAEAASRAPSVSGTYARSIKPYVTARGVSIGSRLPQAGVLHFGGTIRPRGVPITFKPRPVVSDALDRRTDEIVDALGDAVDTAARKAGWH